MPKSAQHEAEKNTEQKQAYQPVFARCFMMFGKLCFVQFGNACYAKQQVMIYSPLSCFAAVMFTLL